MRADSRWYSRPALGIVSCTGFLVCVLCGPFLVFLCSRPCEVTPTYLPTCKQYRLCVTFPIYKPLRCPSSACTTLLSGRLFLRNVARAPKRKRKKIDKPKRGVGEEAMGVASSASRPEASKELTKSKRRRARRRVCVQRDARPRRQGARRGRGPRRRLHGRGLLYRATLGVTLGSHFAE